MVGEGGGGNRAKVPAHTKGLFFLKEDDSGYL